jgi:hypothetical protein
LAALRAVKFSCELGYSQNTLEGDALKIVEALDKCGSNLSIYGYIIEETHSVMNNLQNWKVHYVRRNLNGAAHRLPREALSLREAHCSL